jgi:hypothetical protein
MSIKDRLSEDSPTIMKRLAEESGWIMVGGFDTCGKPTADCARRSATICLARYRSVPGSKYTSTEESPGTDSE